MHTSIRRIGLFGLFGSGNLGNDGSLEAMVNFLRATGANAELTCICADPAKVERAYRLPSIRIRGDEATNGVLRVLQKFGPTRKLLAVLYALRSARKLDVIVMPGTGILDDFGDGFSGMPISLFTWCLSARLCGTKVVFVSVGAGPIVHPLSRWLMKSAARLAQYRSYRDTVSKEFMDSIGFDTSADPIYPDIAFSLPAPATPADTEPLTVGVGVMNYHGWRGSSGPDAAKIYSTYLQKMVHFVLWLLDRGHRVRILMGQTSDQLAIDDLLSTLVLERPDFPRDRVVAEPAHSLHDLMQQIAKTHVVVATRFHNIVCALKLCRPAISIGYAKKNDVLMAEMGLGQFCQHVEHLDVALLIEQFSQLLSTRTQHEQSTRKVNARYLERLGEQEQKLIEILLRS